MSKIVKGLLILVVIVVLVAAAGVSYLFAKYPDVPPPENVTVVSTPDMWNGTNPIQALGVVYYEDPFARVPFGPPPGYNQPEGSLLTVSPGWADEP